MLVRPRNKRYEGSKSPNHIDPWPAQLVFHHGELPVKGFVHNPRTTNSVSSSAGNA